MLKEIMKTLLIVCGFISSFSCNGQKPSPRWDQELLKGNVKKISTSTYYSTNPKDLELISLDKNNCKVDSFDKAGNWLIFYEVKQDIAHVIYRFKYKFDDRGRIVEACRVAEEVDMVGCINSTYDTSGNIVWQSFGDSNKGTRYIYVSD